MRTTKPKLAYYERQKNPRRSGETELAYPILVPQEVPRPFRKFCCFLSAQGPKGTWMGSGTYVETHGVRGILTASHIISNNPPGINIALLLPNNEWTEFTVPSTYVLFNDTELDLAFIQLPTLLPYFEPVKIGWEHRVPFNPNLYAFGCPNGILGKVWKPLFITLAGGIIYTKGWAVPGVSGGGLFTKINHEFYLWGVHIAIHVSSGTLLSRTVKIESLAP